ITFPPAATLRLWIPIQHTSRQDASSINCRQGNALDALLAVSSAEDGIPADVRLGKAVFLAIVGKPVADLLFNLWGCQRLRNALGPESIDCLLRPSSLSRCSNCDRPSSCSQWLLVEPIPKIVLTYVNMTEIVLLDLTSLKVNVIL